MENIIEHIGRHADIDTRRALGLEPRKLPPSNLMIKRGITRLISGRVCTEVKLSPNKAVVAGKDGKIWWVFGRTFNGARIYSFQLNGRVGHRLPHTPIKPGHSWHPDFNEDGTLKKWQTL